MFTPNEKRALGWHLVVVTLAVLGWEYAFVVYFADHHREVGLILYILSMSAITVIPPMKYARISLAEAKAKGINMDPPGG